MPHDLIRLTATEAVALLRKRDISPLDLIDASEARIAAVEPAVTRCQPCASTAPARTPDA